MTKLATRFISISLFLVFAAGCSKTDSSSAVYSENKKAIGASANDLLSASRYNSVTIEIQYMPGVQPDAASVNNLVAFINLLCNKPGGISVVQTGIASGGKTVYSDADVTALEKDNRTVYTSGTQLGIHFLYLDGNYTTSNVLGYAYRNTSMALFGRKIVDNSGGLGQPTRTKLETTVLEHEMGHILGLVNLGSAMQTTHEDGAHAKHCSNTACLMYYQAQVTDIMGPLSTGNIPVLDANCRADLTANGGK
jgi:hypothetical protein